ncbi:hypothetical protein J2853_009667 [Streptosporangium lutulentum]|uniref:Uncharacterized protein n=1 Tax=Streptosporangium lutulentum TaxID=1461250 RepID=A0ABT9QVD4_9ACTN|nr:hypothetical protein [Streptosporangium lutulentum]
MRYLANPSTAAVHEAMRQGLLEMMASPTQGNTLIERVTWGADNGCFTGTYPGDAAFVAWLTARAHHAPHALFAAVPDIVGHAAQTLVRSAPMLPPIRAAGYPALLIAQDGLDDLTVPWTTVDVLFVGGSTPWKLGSAAELVKLGETRSFQSICVIFSRLAGSLIHALVGIRGGIGFV